MAIYLKKKLNVINDLKNIEFINKIDENKPHVKIGILNLMPTLEDTERQFIKVLDNQEVQIELDFIYLNTQTKDPEKVAYFKKYYLSFSEIKKEKYDGLLITGAPLGHLNYQDIDYIDEIKAFFKYTKNNALSTIFLCWAAQFGLQYFYGVNRYRQSQKLSGLYEHYVVNKTPLVDGIDEYFYIPQSRYCSIIEEEILLQKDVILVSKSNESGPYIIESRDGSKIFLTGHAEYELETLDQEYKRDIKKGLLVLPPKNYYQDNNPQNKPLFSWEIVAKSIYHNWIYNYVYKKTLSQNV